jgi:DNA-binding transcriptional ArsR family regulator
MMHMSAGVPVPPDDCSVKCFHPAMVRDARDRLVSASDPGEIAALFAVLSDPTRIRILLALSSAELCVCDLAAATEINRSTVSHQLRILRDHQLVQRRREGKIVYYSLADEHVTTIIGMGSAHAKHSGSGTQKEIA